jgi:hypothetical protein
VPLTILSTTSTSVSSSDGTRKPRRSGNRDSPWLSPNVGTQFADRMPKEELERLSKRRADREAEQRLREQEEIKMQRLTESAQMSEWLAKDDDFQLDQERQRAIIRIKERRAKAIDFLAVNLRYANPDPDDDSEFDLDAAGVEIDLDEPYNIFDVGFLFPRGQSSCTYDVPRICLRNRLTNFTKISNTT